jgi:hypothetical protein
MTYFEDFYGEVLTVFSEAAWILWTELLWVLFLMDLAGTSLFYGPLFLWTSLFMDLFFPVNF